MKDETKEELEVVLELLRATMNKNGVSLAVNKDTGTLYFIDTATYLESHKFDGIKVSIDRLVR